MATNTIPETKPTGLLDLPPEIWSQIGFLAINNEPHFTYSSMLSGRKRGHLQPPITRASRALREELLPYYYKTKICMSKQSLLAIDEYGHNGDLTWIAPLKGSKGADWVARWLRAIGRENRKDVRGLAVWDYGEVVAKRIVKKWKVELELGEVEVHEDGQMEYPVRLL